jgi:thiol-disulfide isomerase/thioredoxin
MKHFCLVKVGLLTAVIVFFCLPALPQAKPAVTRASSKQSGADRVKEIGIEGLRPLLKPNGKPLLINFWATWCDPCRDEFPDIVKIDAEYRGKIDVITVSLDDLADIKGDVPKFLAEMKAEMPAYLLHTDDESAAIKLVSSDWAGNLPLTVLFDENGSIAYQRNGKVSYVALKLNLDRVLKAPPSGNGILETIDFVKVKDGKRDEARYFYENNWRFYRDAAVKRGVIDSYEYIDAASEKDSSFDIILITRYRGEEQFRNSERGFEPIIKELTPNGPFLKGTSKPDDFRQVVYSYTGKAVFTSVR